MNWQALSQQLQQIVTSVVRFAKARRREEATFGLAAILFSLGYFFPQLLPPELRGLVKEWPGNGLVIIQGLFYVAGLILLLYGLYRVWQLVHTPDLPPVRNRPSAIKGPIAFTDADGELFRKLGREDELGKLLGYVEDDQVRLVVLMGASGAGKTSLLRAGLTDILKETGIKYHYWEAVPTNPGVKLLRAIQEGWQAGAHRDAASPGDSASAAVPESLDDLVNPAATLGNQRRVIVLDQFEQLRGGRSANNPVFRLLRKIAREAKPPHRITWIVAFRREFRADWADFMIPEQERQFFPPELSLRLFTVEQARDVISQLIAEADLGIEGRVVDNLIEAAAVDGEVSPVDIGIGLLILAEIHDQQGGQTVTVSDYQFAGGAEGLLTQYINRRLEVFPDADREIILRAMLALRDPETNQRIAEGRTGAELAQETGADARRLNTHLERLTQRDVRLLEAVPAPDNGETRYRLPHERLIPALHRLTGVLLAEAAQAKLKFERAFAAWRDNDRAAQYLLKAQELRLVERYKEQVHWGKAEAEKRAFLRSSQRRRAWQRIVVAAVVISLIGAGWLGNSRYQRYEAQRYLADNGYPPELYDWQHQLRTLNLQQEFNIQRFPWLHSDTLEELTIRVTPSANSLEGLATLTECDSLKKLTLYLRGSQVSDLTPLANLLANLRGLTSLTLALSSSQVSDLSPLANLRGLTSLTLDLGGSRVSDLTLLSKFNSLQILRLKVGTSARMALRAIPPSVTHLDF